MASSRVSSAWGPHLCPFFQEPVAQFDADVARVADVFAGATEFFANRDERLPWLASGWCGHAPALQAVFGVARCSSGCPIAFAAAARGRGEGNF